MSEKHVQTRIIHRHDTEATWHSNTYKNIVPLKGELIIYDIDDNYSYERFKIGDGETTVISLPFVNAAELADKVSKSTTDVQCIQGGLVVGKNSVANISGTGVGRIMFTGQTNPLIGVQAIAADGAAKTPYYVQTVASDDKLYIGPTSTKALMFDNNGNMESPANLTIKGDITEGTKTLSNKYAEKGHSHQAADLPATMPPSSHTHGNISNAGTITSEAVSSATGVLVYDSDNKIQRTTAANARNIIGAGTSSLALGEASTTAYRGDRGKTAYDHSQTVHAPTDAQKNVQSDWNQITTTADDYIKNKPTLGALALKSTVEKSDLVASVQTSLGKADSALQTHQDISGKVDKVTGKGLSTNDFTNEYKEHVERAASIYYSEGLAYILKDDGTYEMSGIGTCTDTNIVIPSNINNITVSSIGDGAFRENASITSIIIPNSVTSIGENAFAFCTNLTSAAIPDSVTNIGKNAFYACAGLASIKIPSNIQRLNDWTFGLCSSLTNIDIPYGVTRIGKSAFRNCSNLVSITIPESVMTIDSSAFYGCSSLDSITITNSVMYFGEDVFYGCNLLIIYCEMPEVPTGAGFDWHPNWNSSNCAIVWGFAPNLAKVNKKLDRIKESIDNYIPPAADSETLGGVKLILEGTTLTISTV